MTVEVASSKVDCKHSVRVTTAPPAATSGRSSCHEGSPMRGGGIFSLWQCRSEMSAPAAHHSARTVEAAAPRIPSLSPGDRLSIRAPWVQHMV